LTSVHFCTKLVVPISVVASIILMFGMAAVNGDQQPIALGRIDIQRSQMMAAARWTKPRK
jgi:hypothetical protein